MFDVATITVITLAFIAAGAVKGALGLGLPTIGMGLLTLVMSPPVAAALMILPSLLTNIWQALDGGATRDLLRRLWPMLATAFVVTALSSPLVVNASAATSGFWLGVALLAYAVSGLLNWKLPVPDRAEPVMGIGIGAATGVVTGASGVFVLPSVPYLAGIGLERDRLVQAMGMSFTFSTFGLAIGLAAQGQMSAGATGASAFAVIPALVGMRIGSALRARISATTFRRLFFLLLGALGLQCIIAGLMA